MFISIKKNIKYVVSPFTKNCYNCQLSWIFYIPCNYAIYWGVPICMVCHYYQIIGSDRPDWRRLLTNTNNDYQHSDITISRLPTNTISRWLTLTYKLHLFCRVFQKKTCALYWTNYSAKSCGVWQKSKSWPLVIIVYF